MRNIWQLLLGAVVALAPIGGLALAQQSETKAKPATTRKASAPPGMKICNYKFPDGERRTWTCRKEEPCCAWDAIKYVKCGSTVTNCL